MLNPCSLEDLLGNAPENPIAKSQDDICPSYSNGTHRLAWKKKENMYTSNATCTSAVMLQLRGGAGVRGLAAFCCICNVDFSV